MPISWLNMWSLTFTALLPPNLRSHYNPLKVTLHYSPALTGVPAEFISTASSALPNPVKQACNVQILNPASNTATFIRSVRFRFLPVCHSLNENVASKSKACEETVDTINAFKVLFIYIDIFVAYQLLKAGIRTHI